MFGLHMNAIITVEFNETRNILGTSLMLQPRDAGSGGGGKSPDETVTDVTISIQERLPDVMTEDEAGPKAFVMRGEYLDSLSTALKTGDGPLQQDHSKDASNAKGHSARDQRGSAHECRT